MLSYEEKTRLQRKVVERRHRTESGQQQRSSVLGELE